MTNFMIKGFLGLMLVACAKTMPVPENERIADPVNSELIAEFIVDTWLARLDVDGRDLEIPPILWFSGDCLIYHGLERAIMEEPCLTGLYYWQTSIHGMDEEIHAIWKDGRESASDTALTHELLHFSLKNVTGDPDPSHKGPLWQETREVNSELRGFLDSVIR